MKWPWPRKPDPAPTSATPPPTAGAKAHEQAREDYEETVARWPEVREVAGSLRRLRRDNGFREQIEFMFEGGHRT